MKLPFPQHLKISGLSMVMSYHLQEISNGKELSDLHIHAFQNIMKAQFPHIRGHLNPLFQESTSLQCDVNEIAIQVLHIDKCDCAVCRIDQNKHFFSE